MPPAHAGDGAESGASWRVSPKDFPARRTEEVQSAKERERPDADAVSDVGRNEVLKIEPRVANSFFIGSGVFLKAHELGDLEARVKKLEEKQGI